MPPALLWKLPADPRTGENFRPVASESAIPANGPGKVLFEYGRRECLVFVGGDPNFDGDELPVFLSFLLVPVTANGRGLLSLHQHWPPDWPGSLSE